MRRYGKREDIGESSQEESVTNQGRKRGRPPGSTNKSKASLASPVRKSVRVSARKRESLPDMDNGMVQEVSTVTKKLRSVYRIGKVNFSTSISMLQAGRSRDRILVGARFSAPVQTSPGAHPVSCTMDTGSFPGVKSGRGMTLTPHPLLVLWSRKSRAIPLLPLWAVWPVQSLSACTRAHFTFYQYASECKRYVHLWQ